MREPVKDVKRREKRKRIKKRLKCKNKKSERVLKISLHFEEFLCSKNELKLNESTV